MIHLGAVDGTVVGPQAEPVAVRQRGGLLEGAQENDGHDESQAHGSEVVGVYLQLHLTTQSRRVCFVNVNFPSGS